MFKMEQRPLELLNWRGTCIQHLLCLYVIDVVVGGVRRGLRSVWDAFVFHAVIKKRGLIPSRDGFTVRRIAGPGLASSYFFQVTYSDLLFLYHMETFLSISFELFGYWVECSQRVQSVQVANGIQ